MPEPRPHRNWASVAHGTFLELTEHKAQSSLASVLRSGVHQTVAAASSAFRYVMIAAGAAGKGGLMEESTMTGSLVGPCNCDWGCPCNFMAPPSYGNCEGVYVYFRW